MVKARRRSVLILAIYFWLKDEITRTIRQKELSEEEQSKLEKLFP